MINNFLPFLSYLGAFAFVLLVIVFVHEYGHYITAKRLGVKIEIFSIGFGKELFGWNDKSGTRWKICLLPLGGYVKMFGDVNAASAPDTTKLKKLTNAEKKYAFHAKPLWAKALIVSAGPIANFVLAFVLLTSLFFHDGKPYALPVISEVIAGTAADKAGLKAGDRINAIDNTAIDSFSDIQQQLALNTGTPILLDITRNKKSLIIEITPRIEAQTDPFGNEIYMPILGIRSLEFSIQKLSLTESLLEGAKQVYVIGASTLKGIAQMITGERSIKEISGPIGIAKYSGDAAQQGFRTLLSLIIIISVNLGMINLFPIPVLDGGHLLYYAIEAARGKPLAEKFQEWGTRVGMFFIAILTIFAILNDIVKFA